MYSVYTHRRNDNGQIMYVGCGIRDRPFQTEGRNSLWTKVSNQFGYTVEIVESNLECDYALMLEAHLIHKYKDNGFLTNKSPGHINKFLVYGISLSNELIVMNGDDITSRGYNPAAINSSINGKYKYDTRYMLIEWFRCIDNTSYNHLSDLYIQANNKIGRFDCDIWSVGYRDIIIDKRVLDEFMMNNQYQSIFTTI